MFRLNVYKEIAILLSFDGLWEAVDVNAKLMKSYAEVT
jgi:hypothetical protein